MVHMLGFCVGSFFKNVVLEYFQFCNHLGDKEKYVILLYCVIAEV